MKQFVMCLLLCLSANAQLKTKVNAVASGTTPSVSLSCTPSTAGATPTGFNFYRSTTSGSGYGVVGTSATCAFTDTIVAFSATYFYVATAFDAAGESGFSSQVTAVIPANPVPNPPTGLTVGAITATSVPLNWNVPVSQPGVTVASYGIFDCSQPTCPAPPKIATVTGTSYTALCLHKNGICYFEVKASDLVAGKKVTTGPSNIVEAKVN